MVGIGHANHLNSMGIPVIADLPVGDNLQEHVASGVSFVLNDSVVLNMVLESTPYNILEYFIKKKNKLTSNLLEGISFVKTKYEDQSDDWPDIQFHMLPGIEKKVNK
jgi:choline dehydrogenase-like flavoprotein